MKYQKNTIFSKKIDAFSLMEIIIAITLSTFLMCFLFWSVIVIYRGLHRTENNSFIIKDKSELFKIISGDILNPDIYPHHPVDKYVLNNNGITFFANGGKVEYIFNKNELVINKEKDNKKYKFDFVDDFIVTYYDKDGFQVFNTDIFPYYCELKFIMKDKKEIKLNMKL